MYVPRHDAPSNRTSTSPFPFLASTEMPNSPSSGRTHKKSPWRSVPSSTRPTRRSCHLAGRSARQGSWPPTPNWPGNWPAPYILCRGSSKPWSLVCSTGSARGKGQPFSKRCGWRTRGMEGSSRLRHNSSTVTKFKHTKFKDPSLCFVSTQSRRPLERRQLRICQEDGKVRYAARALTDSPTAKDFPYRGGDTYKVTPLMKFLFALTIMYWFALRNLPCFFFCATLMGPFLHKGIRLSLL